MGYAPSAWCVLDTYPDRVSAEIAAGLLAGHGIPVKVDPLGDFPGHERGAELVVDAQCLARARWLLSLRVTDAELEDLALRTGGDTGAA